VFALLALASAGCYGAADFLGGLTSKRASTLAIVVVSQLTGLLLLLVAFPFIPAASPHRMDFVWGAVAGLTGGTGVALLYRALAIGVMAVVAPTTAVCAVVIPVLVAIGLGERPGIVTIGGIVLAIIAIALVSQSDHPEPVLRGQRAGSGASAFTLALLSGVAIGLFFVLAAPASRAPLTIRVLGLIVIIAGLSTPWFGVARSQAVLDWMASADRC